MSRSIVTQKIVQNKVKFGLTWQQVAEAVGLSKEWVTAACLGQMTLTAAEAQIVGGLFDLDEMDIKWLQEVPYKGSLTRSCTD
jgi:cyanate lyase